MLIDGRQLSNQVIETDLAIIGAGAAGIAIASQFLNSSIRVALMESGGLDPDPKIQALYKAETGPFPYSLEASRLRYFGGTTNHWNGMCAPLTPIDFEVRPWIKNSGWPITYEEIEPYYREASKFLNMSGNGEESFIPSPPLFKNSEAFTFHMWRFPSNLRLANAYKSSLENSANVRVFLNSNVTDIITNSSGTQVTELHFKTLSGQQFSVRAKRYVLACGGIENARLLLSSQKTVPAGLGNGYDQVGRYFLEHPHLSMGEMYFFGLNPITTQYLETSESGDSDITLKILNITHADNVMAQENLLQSSLVFRHMQKIDQLPSPVAYMRNVMGKQTDAVYRMEIYSRTEMLPNPENRVTLLDKKDALGMPMSRLNFTIGEAEWRSCVTLAKNVSGAYSAERLGVAHLHPWTGKTGQWPGFKEWGYHHMGTTRMGHAPKQSVVNKDCGVHGLDNFYIAGSSVFPTCGWANPTYTLIALALRLAAHIKSQNA